MGEKITHLRLKKELIKISESDNLEEVLNEWEFDFYKYDSSRKAKCICGQNNLVHISYLKHIEKALYITIGSDCIKEFIHNEKWKQFHKQHNKLKRKKLKEIKLKKRLKKLQELIKIINNMKEKKPTVDKFLFGVDNEETISIFDTKNNLTSEYPSGVYMKKPGYEWIIANMSIDKKKFILWLQAQTEDNVHIQILKSRKNTMYAKKYSYNKPKLQSEDPVIKNNLENDEDFWNE